jgi:hypothetical protein
MSKRAPLDINPRAFAADLLHGLGGMKDAIKWGKTHRSLAYQLIAKLMAQPLVQQTNVNVNVDRSGEAARAKLEDAFLRLIDAQKHQIGDPAVYVNNERVIDHKPQARSPPTAAVRPGTRFRF